MAEPTYEIKATTEHVRGTPVCTVNFVASRGAEILLNLVLFGCPSWDEACAQARILSSYFYWLNVNGWELRPKDPGKTPEQQVAEAFEILKVRAGAVHLDRHPLLQQVYDVMGAIEECGASVELTNAVTKAGELLDAVSNFVNQYSEMQHRMEGLEK